MIEQTRINRVIAEGLKAVTGCEVVKANLTKAPIPPYPYISFSITQTETRRGTYSKGEKCYMPLSQTWSITVQGENDDEALQKAMEARDWLEEVGRLELADQGIVVSRVGAIHNRDTLLTLEYEYRKGFDVVFSLMNVVDSERKEVIEQAEIRKE